MATASAFASDAQAHEIYAAAVASIVAAYDGQGVVFESAKWRGAERAIEVAFASRDAAQFVKAVGAFERVGIALLAEQGTSQEPACLHADDDEIAAWKIDHPAMRCSRCFVEAAQ